MMERTTQKHRFGEKLIPSRHEHGSGRRPLKISHPKTASLRHGLFVVSGLSDPQVNFVVGCLIDTSTNNIIPGKTVFNSPKWGIYFRDVPMGKYILEVIGITIDPTTELPTTEIVSRGLEIKARPFDSILWPGNGDSACLSNFCPYGTYDTGTTGTISVSVHSASTGDHASVNALTDGVGGWCAQITTLTHESNDYELDVTDTGAASPPPVTGLNLNQASC